MTTQAFEQFDVMDTQALAAVGGGDSILHDCLFFIDYLMGNAGCVEDYNGQGDSLCWTGPDAISRYYS
ncbi:Uncharacterised protein [Streptococcus criceti]|uniref:Uncharacterized protein n=1 Tax=Streptococcus criceti HS-6 TaxID=873449 RepID=G5JPG9_STRCG|nr:hypothetical protein [Streptococcus criceti]EHI73353.1 hypothetical protein STRCR_1621 [Streptococcus criceti HS-6]SUN43264.1 Uncharacterised protein [Streptococcus criceti]